MSNCRNCGIILEAGCRYCGNCGTAVPKNRIPKTGPVSDATLIICPSCGAFVRGDRRYCTTCGKPLHEEPDPQPTERRLPIEWILDVTRLSESALRDLAAILYGDAEKAFTLQLLGTITEQFSVVSPASNEPRSDRLYFAMLRSSLSELGNRFPGLSGRISCRYPPFPENLAKGYDDFGGFYTIRLENGVVREDDQPIA